MASPLPYAASMSTTGLFFPFASSFSTLDIGECVPIALFQALGASWRDGGRLRLQFKVRKRAVSSSSSSSSSFSSSFGQIYYFWNPTSSKGVVSLRRLSGPRFHGPVHSPPMFVIRPRPFFSIISYHSPFPPCGPLLWTFRRLCQTFWSSMVAAKIWIVLSCAPHLRRQREDPHYQHLAERQNLRLWSEKWQQISVFRNWHWFSRECGVLRIRRKGYKARSCSFLKHM